MVVKPFRTQVKDEPFLASTSFMSTQQALEGPKSSSPNVAASATRSSRTIWRVLASQGQKTPIEISRVGS